MTAPFCFGWCLTVSSSYVLPIANAELVEGLPKAKEPFDKLRINSAT